MDPEHTMTIARPDTKPFSWRAFVTFYVVLSFLVIALTGIVLFITPPGRIANWSDWRLLGFSKSQWQTVHTIFSFIFIVAASFHLFFNWRVILGYLAKRFQEGINKRRELGAAVTIGVIVFVMAADGMVPFGTVMAWGEEIKNSWSTPSTEPPVPHAELLSIARLAGEMKIPVNELMLRLSAAGIVPDSAGMSVKDLASRYSLTPKQVYDRAGIQPPPAMPAGGGPGYGRKSVASLCEEAGITIDEGLARLGAAGLSAEPGTTIRTVAQAAGMSPADVVAIIQGQPVRKEE
jgi:hypothetical protein